MNADLTLISKLSSFHVFTFTCFKWELLLSFTLATNAPQECCLVLANIILWQFVYLRDNLLSSLEGIEVLKHVKVKCPC